MSLKKTKSKFAEDENGDPMAGVVNMVDLMLVLAVGFMIFAVMATGMENIVFSDMPQDQKESAMQSAANTQEIEEGEELDEIPENISQAGGSGYTEMGTVYQDSKTGKMIVVSNNTNVILPVLKLTS